MKKDFKQEAMRINDELIRSIKVSLIHIGLFVKVIKREPKIYDVLRDDIEVSIKKTKAWLETAKARKQKLEEEE